MENETRRIHEIYPWDRLRAPHGLANLLEAREERVEGLLMVRCTAAASSWEPCKRIGRAHIRDDNRRARDRAHEQRECCLFYVASTRARDELVITGFGAPSTFLRRPFLADAASKLGAGADDAG